MCSLPLLLAALACAPAAADAFDDAHTAAQGIRKLTSHRFTLYTDLPANAEIEQLPELFEQAIPQWCRYFRVAAEKVASWHVTGHLMRQRAAFEAAGLLPDDLPPFEHGYSKADAIWWYEAPSAYYRRHLMLHECTHAFMLTAFGTCGPPWYMEGMAELLGTHSWQNETLRLAVFPTRGEDVPEWGRVKLVRNAVADGRLLSLAQIMNYGPRDHLQVEAYGWCWAAAAFLDGHPRYRQRFGRLPAELGAADFNGRVREVFADDWHDLTEEWQVFAHGIEFGYDLARNAIEFADGEPLADEAKQITIRADRGWQSSRLRLASGVTYRLAAAGRYQVARRPRVWWCEPGGVTIRYWRTRPQGQLLAALRYDDAAAASGLLQPVAVGLQAEFTPERSGTLYLRVNDSPAELDDNQGTLTVEVSAGGL